MQVVAVATEDLVFAHPHFHVQVARRRARRPGLALALQAHAVTIVHPGRDFHRQGLVVLDPARAPAVPARIADRLAATAAIRATLLHGEDAALEAHLAAPVAGAAGLDLAILRTAALAVAAVGQGRDLDALLDPGHRFFQVQLHHVADVGATPGPARATGTAEDRTEDVAEDVVHVRPLAGPAPHAVLEGRMPVGVVGTPPRRIGQHLVGLLALLERRLGGGVAGIAVRVVLHGAAAIGLLQLFVTGIAGHAQHFVVVALAHRNSIRPS